MNSILSHSPVVIPPIEVNNDMQISVNESLSKNNGGSELPGSAIHVQLLVRTEGCIAAGCPEDLW